MPRKKPSPQQKWAKKNRDKLRAACRRWRKRHPEKQKAATYRWRRKNLAKWNAYQRRWRRRNRQRTNEILRFKRRHKAESHNTKRRLYRRENLEKLRKRAREYYRKHFARKRAEHRNAIAKRKRAKGRFTAREFLLVLKKHKYRCAYCKRQISRSSATIDHVVPLSRGGTNWITNIIPACLRCNQRKSFMSLGRFIARLKKEGDLDQ